MYLAWEVVWQTKPLTIVLLCDFNEMGIISTMSLCNLYNKIIYCGEFQFYFLIYQETCCSSWPEEKLVTEEYLKIENIHIQKHIDYTRAQYSINVSDSNMVKLNTRRSSILKIIEALYNYHLSCYCVSVTKLVSYS